MTIARKTGTPTAVATVTVVWSAALSLLDDWALDVEGRAALVGWLEGFPCRLLQTDDSTDGSMVDGGADG